MDFDPNETVGGIKIRGLNYTITGRGKYPWSAQLYFDGSSYWTEGRWSEIGEWLHKRDGSTRHDLKPLNTPEPAPVPVDWTQPVRWKNSHLSVERLMGLKKSDEDVWHLLKWSNETGECAAQFDDTDVDRLFENVPPEPPAPRVVTVEVAACEHNSHPVAYAIRWPSGIIRTYKEDGESLHWYTTGELAFGRFETSGFKITSPWVSHEFVLPSLPSRSQP